MIFIPSFRKKKSFIPGLIRKEKDTDADNL